MSSDLQVDTEAITMFLKGLLTPQLEAPARNWLLEKLDTLTQQPQPKDLYLTFSAIPRFLGKGPLITTHKDLLKANELREGLNLEGWTIPQTARILSVCSYPYPDAPSFLQIIDQIFSSAEVTELVALYSALPVLPYPEQLKARAAEGIRTNMSVVFDAVVLNNPYPFDFLEQPAWNQMVLKALFMERPLYKVYGLEKRSNQTLSKMISNFAHERWAAGRPTSPEMWRPIGNQGIPSIYPDLEKLMEMDDADQHAAAVLAAKALKTREAQAFLDHHYSVVTRVNQNNTTWDDIGSRWWSKQNHN